MRRFLTIALAVLILAVPAAAAPVIASTTQTEITVGGLTCGTSYRVRVNVAGSNTVTTLNTATQPCTPPPPATITVNTNIVEGSEVPAGTVWTATASGAPISSVHFYIDGVDSWTESISPYQFNGDPDGTLTLGSGAHTLKVTAFASNGASGSVTRNVTSGTAPPPPTPGGYPDASNTGPTNPALLTPYTGPYTIITDGTVIENAIFTQRVNVAASNVTFRNSLFKGHDWYLLDPGPNTVIEDSEFDGGNFDNNDSAIYGEGVNWTGRRLDIHGTKDGLKMNAGTLEDSWVHDVYRCSSCHADAIQIMSHSGPIVVRHNTLTMDFYDNGAFQIAPDFGSITDVLVDNNLMAGGGFTFRVHGYAAGSVSNIRLNNNHFVRNSYQYGPISLQADAGSPGTTCSGNVFHDNLQPLSC